MAACLNLDDLEQSGSFYKDVYAAGDAINGLRVLSSSSSVVMAHVMVESGC